MVPKSSEWKWDEKKERKKELERKKEPLTSWVQFLEDLDNSIYSSAEVSTWIESNEWQRRKKDLLENQN